MRLVVERVARFMAVLGGVVLLAVVVMTCFSIIGREMHEFAKSDYLTAIAPAAADWIGAVPGDYELASAGVGFAIFAFLPACQLYRGHATVELFTSALPRGGQRAIAAFWEVVLTAAILLITWRLGVGLSDKISNGETTFFLRFPIWWSYAASFSAAVAASLVALYCAVERVTEAVTGRDAPSEGAPL